MKREGGCLYMDANGGTVYDLFYKVEGELREKEKDLGDQGDHDSELDVQLILYGRYFVIDLLFAFSMEFW